MQKCELIQHLTAWLKMQSKHHEKEIECLKAGYEKSLAHFQNLSAGSIKIKRSIVKADEYAVKCESISIDQDEAIATNFLNSSWVKKKKILANREDKIRNELKMGLKMNLSKFFWLQIGEDQKVVNTVILNNNQLEKWPTWCQERIRSDDFGKGN